MNSQDARTPFPGLTDRRLAMLTCLAMTAAAAGWASGQTAKLEPFSYHEGFEKGDPKFELWAKNGPSTVASCGPSEEQAFEGKRSGKLDVTLDGGSYHYYGIKAPARCAGRLKLTARVFVAAGTTAKVGFGTNMMYPRTHHSGCSPAKTFDKPTGKWETVEIDLVARGKGGAASVMANYTGTMRGEDVGATLDRWSLFILGGKGKRAIVYVDDVRIEGQVPSQADFNKDLDRRWRQAQERLGKRIAAWQAELAKAKKGLAAMADPPELIRDYVASYKAGVKRAESLIGQLAKRGYGSRHDAAGIASAIKAVDYGPETVAAVTKGLAEGAPYLIYTPPAITNRQFTATLFPIPAPLGKTVTCSACRGEYESATLVVYALKDLEQVTLSAGNLAGPGYTIPASAVDLYAVKCWYQAAKGIWSRTKSKLPTPELLLKDDELVRVDRDAKANYLRSTGEDGKERYVLCSGPTSGGLAKVRPVDAETLQPVDVPAKTVKQFWLTVRIPDDARSGTYRGTVTLATRSGKRLIPLEVTVHPFDLAASRLTYSIYYRGKLSGDGKPTIGSEHKSERQYRAEIADMKAHGVLYPTNYHGYDPSRLRRILEIRREEGLPAGRFYNLGQSTGSTTKPEKLAELGRNVKKWLAFCKPFGYEEVYFYGVDEARGDRLRAQRATWGAVQQAGGKTYVACYTKTFEAMGKLLNCAVLAGRPDPEEADKWHGVGSHAFCYAYPQVGNEEPETYRRNFGLVLWRAGFDGAMDYAYQHAFGHIWNDYDHNHYRDHNFTYPTIDGVVGTIQWEGFREAVDDVRYATTLERAIDAAGANRAPLADRARKWLADLDPDTADLDETRRRMVALTRSLLE